MLYAVAKKKFDIQKQKLAENMTKAKEFWTETNKINPTSKIVSTSIDQASSPLEISKLFLKKYRLLYNRVPTDNNELRSLHDAINNGITMEYT